MENMCREDLMKLIQSTNFIVIELAMYLDTHPLDEEARLRYQRHLKEYRKLKAEYEENFGPLTPRADSDEWLSDPWPWENI